jgi:hypothetical protein
MTERDLRKRIEFDAGNSDALVSIESFIDTAPKKPDFNDLHVAVNDLGARFWGLDLRSSDRYMSHGDGLQPRLRVLKKILSVAPVDETTSSKESENVSSAVKWGEIPVEKYIKIAERNSKLVLRDTLSTRPTKPSLHKHFTDAPITYDDAHHDSYLRLQAANALKHIGDPTYEIVRSLEGWRYLFEEQYIPQRSLNLGRNVFRIFMFSAGSENYMQALGTAASWHYRFDQKTL